MMENSIQFILNNELQTFGNKISNITLLEYLRNGKNLRGTKEGCASGDCGACTAVVAELNDDATLSYQTINTCITLLPTLHGKQLITVENLKEGTTLHPAQQALVDNHGSQCGFCTPGFVMSMFALQKNNATPTEHQIKEALAGNLCRCTGYRSIVDAAVQQVNRMQSLCKDKFERQQKATMRELQKINQTANIKSADEHQSCFSPSSINQLMQLIEEHPQAELLAGGTDLSLVMTQQLKKLDHVIYIGRVAELQQIKETESALSIGAAVPYSVFDQRLGQEHPEFGAMISRLGSLQVRNRGTLGGNIGNASPIGDMPPVLIALGATMTMRQGKLERHIAVEDYFLDYKVTALRQGEIIRSVEIPNSKTDHHLKVYKISKRLDDDISTVLAAFHICIQDNFITAIRIAFGGMAEIPKRAVKCEAALLGQPWSQTNIEAAMAILEQDFKPVSDARASSHYRMQVAKNLLLKCYLELESTTSNTNVVNYF